MAASALLVVGCQKQKEARFSCDYTITYHIDSISSLSVSDIIDHGQPGPKVRGISLPLNSTDSKGFKAMILHQKLYPMSSAEGKSFSGNVFFAIDSIENINSAFLLDPKERKIYVYPDEIAAQGLATADNKEFALVFDGLLASPIHAESMAMQLANVQNSKVDQLNLLHPNSIYVLGENDCDVSSKRFDLSGLAFYKNKMICIADKKWTTDIYYFDTASTGEFFINLAVKGPDYKTEDCDIEAVDTYNGRILISEETNNQIYMQNDKGDFELMPIDFTKIDSDLSDWGAANAGVEGFAVDSKNGIIYFAKEREPRRLFTYDIKSGEFATPFDDVVLPYDGDISDMQYIDGYIYYLDRANCLVSRIDVKTKEKVIYSFRQYSNNGKEHIYEADYGMAEALLITSNAIFVGMDNNNDPVSKYGSEIGLTAGSTKPSVFVFHRPKDF